MKQAVEMLQPVIEKENKQCGHAAKAGKILLATVKGDVHDIGKNMVSVVMACNNYEIVDLGVMVPADVIVRRAMEERVDMIGLSGLIAPSLDEMVEVAKELQRNGLKIPIMIGGATTSKVHTALKIAPAYDAPVVWVKDASQNVLIASQLLNPTLALDYVEGLNAEYANLRAERAEELSIVSLAEARKNKINLF